MSRLKNKEHTDWLLWQSNDNVYVQIKLNRRAIVPCEARTEKLKKREGKSEEQADPNFRNLQTNSQVSRNKKERQNPNRARYVP